MTNPFTLSDHSRTHPGNVRKVNEDSLLCKSSEGLWVVADGMGGHDAGDVASQLIVSELDTLPPQNYTSDLIDEVENTLHQVNTKLVQLAEQRQRGSIIGSTVACLIIRESMGLVLWVGDSRLYRQRGSQLEQITRDHSELQRRIDSGQLSEGDAESCSYKNVLSRAVGAFQELEVDVNAFNVEQGDTFLLCSDGLYNEISDNEIAQILSLDNFDAIPDKLLNNCLESEAKDNISLILVKAN